MSGKTRQSNIELLRILTMCGVVVLHYNGNFAFSMVDANSCNAWLLNILEVVFICAVNLFVLISGYFLSASSQRRLIRPLELVVQVMVIGVLKYALSAVGGNAISLRSLVGAAIPNNYFVTLYVTVYLLSPYINLATDKLDLRLHRNLILLLVGLFALWPTCLDVLALMGHSYVGLYPTSMEGSQYGYSFVNFALLYMIGGYLRKNPRLHNWKVYLLAFVCSSALLVLMQLKFPQVARAYSNPLVIINSICLFQLFRQMSVHSNFINKLAGGAFTCFLLHDALLPYLNIQRFVNGNIFVLVLHLLISVVGIYFVSWIIWKIYDWASKPIFRWLEAHTKKLDARLFPQPTQKG